MKKYFCLFSLLFFSVFSAFSRQIETIEIIGLKKTDESYVQSLLKEYCGKESSSVDAADVETVLQAEGIFSEVHVSVNEEKISIEVKEKITFLPLPFASYSSDGFMGGFVLMNMNAFGRKNNIIAGGLVRRNMYTGMMMFSKPAVNISKPGFFAFCSVSYRENEVTDFFNDTVYEGDSFFVRGTLAVEEKLLPFLKLSLDAGYTLANIWDAMEDPVVNLWLFGTKISLSDVNWNGWYLITNSFNARAALGFDADGNYVQEYSAFGELQVPFVPRVRGVLRASGIMSWNKNILLLNGRTDVGSTILYSKFRSERLAASSFMLETSVFRKKVATVSVYGSYECAVARDFDESTAFAHGPGTGLRVYLQQVAFPALALGVSYNVPENLFQVAASIGVAF